MEKRFTPCLRAYLRAGWTIVSELSNSRYAERVMLSREQMLKKLHLRDEYYRRRARGSFAEFLRHTKALAC